ncbi:hypothetical protein [Celerinatantimonas yamalensis]|uniref:Uncharacterized protein n=1 Tax=Celerinatantimonas yamalensis TaxID=559956 RepID=A0ABW9G6V8_9GAMM
MNDRYKVTLTAEGEPLRHQAAHIPDKIACTDQCSDTQIEMLRHQLVERRSILHKANLSL